MMTGTGVGVGVGDGRSGMVEMTSSSVDAGVEVFCDMAVRVASENS